MTTAKSLIGLFTVVVGAGFAQPALCEDNDAEKKGTDKTTTARTPVDVTSSEKAEGRDPKVAGWPRSGEDEASGDPWGAALAIFGVLSAAGVSSIFLRKRKRGGETGGDVIEVLATKHVAPRTKVVLLSTRHREVLISVGQDGATLLTEWLSDDTALPRATPTSRPHRSEPAVTFDDIVEEEGGPESEALLELARAPSVPDAADRPSAAEYRPRKRNDSEAVAGLLALRQGRGEGEAPSQVESLESRGDWTKRLMRQMRTGGGRS